MVITLRSCSLRPFRAGDEDSLVHHANDRDIWKNVRDRFPHPYTRAAAEQWIAFTGAQDPSRDLAIDVDGAVVGGIGLTPQEDVFRRSAEIGYWLGKDLRGRGIATDALRAMTDHAFSTFDLCRIFAGVFEHNPASIRVLEKAGYAFEGRLRKAVFKDGAMMDQLLYATVR
jgi:[ribosomal protein S5]-alanine N-acetyltransferase